MTQIVLDPYAHYPAMTFPGEFALKGVSSELWNNTTGVGTYYEHCSQAGGTRLLLDFEKIMWVDYKLFPLSMITPAQISDLTWIINNPQPLLVLHISLEEWDTLYTGLYLETLHPALAQVDKTLYIEVVYKGAYNHWRFKKVGAEIVKHLTPYSQNITYIHTDCDTNRYIVDPYTAAHVPF